MCAAHCVYVRPPYALVGCEIAASWGSLSLSAACKHALCCAAGDWNTDRLGASRQHQHFRFSQQLSWNFF